MKKKITIALDENILSRIDTEVENGKSKNRSAAIESHLVKHYGDFTDASAIIFAYDYKWDNREYPFDVPKSLLSVRDVPILVRQIQKYLWIGVSDIHILIPKGDKKIFESTLKLQFPWNVFTFYEVDVNIQTWDALAEVINQGILWEKLFISNGDIFFWNLDIEKYYEFFKRKSVDFAMCLKFVMTPEQLWNVVIQGEKIIDFVEKPKAQASYLTNSGMYITSLSFLQKNNFWSYLEKDFFPTICNNFEVAWFLYSWEWEHIQNDSTFERVNWYLM